MQGNAPGGGYGPPAAQGPQPQPSGPVPPGDSFSTRPTKSSRLALLLGVVAVLLAAAALVVSLVREPKASAPTATPAPSPTASVPAEQLFVDDADRALCQAIAPLMRENDQETRAFAQHKSGSPEQQSALPSYRRFTEDWASRIQLILNEKSTPPRFLTRTLQRFIDDMLIYVSSDSVSDEVGVNTWKLSLSDYSGPSGRCRDLGAHWP
jgi:hypothetical protein